MRFAFAASTITVALLMAGPSVTAEPVMTDIDTGNAVRPVALDLVSTLAAVEQADLEPLAQFYIKRDMRPVWVEDERPTERARELLEILENALYDGLDPADYHTGTIRRLMASRQTAELAELDLRLSLSLMQYLSDLGSGRTEPNTLDPELFVYPQDIDKAEAIEAAAEAEDIGVFVGGYRPRQVEYWRLKGVLASYRAMARYGGWSSIDAGPTLQEGDRSPRVAQLRTRLQRGGDLQQSPHLQGPIDSELFDQPLVKAVESFQRRHGLELDGKVGPRTLQAMNTPIEERIEQLVLNLERRRWMTDGFKSRYIHVNLADFHLQLIDDGDVVFDTPVVIGSLYNKTPVFSADMTHLVINPYWNVPQSIASKELLAKVKADPDYFGKNGFDLFEDWSDDAERLDPETIDWTALTPDAFRYKLRQRPGATNALGQVKFMLPNDFAIYLHDTPHQTHFSANQRSFSHGCIRVADPEALAHAILKGQSDWTLDGVLGAIESGERRQVNLDEALPVQITYLTAWVDEESQVHFRDDVYGRDRILADVLIDDGDERDRYARDVTTEARRHDAAWRAATAIR